MSRIDQVLLGVCALALAAVGWKLMPRTIARPPRTLAPNEWTSITSDVTPVDGATGKDTLVIYTSYTCATATPLAAQQQTFTTRADTAAILRAAVDSGWHLVSTRGFQIVGDTATLVVEQQKELPHGAVPRTDSQPAQLVNTARRVERRGGKWVRRPN